MFIENFWLFVIVVMCVGAILGFAFFSLRYRNSRRIQQLQEQLESKTEELVSYRGDVNEHFLRTAELVDTLTQSYKTVYDHLEGGAYRLVGEEAFRKQLADRKQLQLEAFSSSTLRELGSEDSDEGSEGSGEARGSGGPQGEEPEHAPSAAAIVIEEDLENLRDAPPFRRGAEGARAGSGPRVVQLEDAEEAPRRVGQGPA